MLENLERLSQSGDSEAQFQLAQILQHGVGVAMDEDAALRWYHKAAEKQYERAQYALGEIYKEGRITPQDLVSSYAWYLIVENRNGALAVAARENCDLLTDFMTPEQIVEAKGRAGQG